MSDACTGPPAPVVARSRHVYEADIVRVLTFGCVIAVHTIHYTNPGTSVGSNGVEMLLHFTREAFFCLTGFVLVLGSLHRPLALKSFWRKRLPAVALPYLTWSIVYELIATHWSVSGTLRRLPADLALGTAWYHLYFLLVSMQIYLVFPLIHWLVRRTAGHHRALLAVSGAIQLVVLALLTYAAPSSGWATHIVAHADVLLPSYQFYVLLGAVAACHSDRMLELARARRPTIVVLGLLSAGAAEVWYLVAVHLGTRPVDAAAVLQPVMVVWSVGAVALLVVIGSIWSDRRVPGGRADTALAAASDRSFGIFLVHPLVLWLLLQARSQWLPQLWGPALTVPAYIVVVAGSLAFTEVFRRSPVSLALTGRRRPARAPHATRHPAAPEQHRRADHVRDNADTPPAPVQAPHDGRDNGDRSRTADPLLR